MKQIWIILIASFVFLSQCTYLRKKMHEVSEDMFQPIQAYMLNSGDDPTLEKTQVLSNQFNEKSKKAKQITLIQMFQLLPKPTVSFKEFEMLMPEERNLYIKGLNFNTI